MRKLLILIAFLFLATHAEAFRISERMRPMLAVSGIQYTLYWDGTGASDGALTDTQVLDTYAEGISTLQTGSGTLTVVDTGAGTVAVSSNRLRITGSGASPTTGVYSQAFTRSIGLTSLVKFTQNGSGAVFLNSWTETNGIDITPISSVLPWSGNALLHGYTINLYPISGVAISGQSYDTAIITGGFDSTGIPYKIGDTKASYLYGSHYFVKSLTDALYPVWTHYAFTPKYNNSPMYFSSASRVAAVALDVDNIRIPVDDLSALLQPHELDTFTDSNGTALTAHTMDVGTGWTKRYCDTNGDEINDTYVGTWEIDGNYAELKAIGGTACNHDPQDYATVSAVADGISSVKARFDEGGSNYYNGLIVRAGDETAGGSNLIYAIIAEQGAHNAILGKLVNGTGTVFASVSGAYVGGTYYQITIQHIGTSLRFYVDGSKLGADFTASDGLTNTGVGIMSGNGAISDKGYDNFSVHGATTNGNGVTYESILGGY